MTHHEDWRESLVEQRVTYSLDMDGRFYLIENVPARVDVNTGESFFSPETVERLQRLIRDGEPPVRVIETPVYQFSGS